MPKQAISPLLMSLICLSLLAGCSSGRHETVKFESCYVGVNVPEEWVRGRSTNEWRMPDKGAWHFQVEIIEGDRFKPTIETLKQLASLLEQPDSEIPVELCGKLKSQAEKISRELPLSDPEMRQLVPQVLKFHVGSATLLSQVKGKVKVDRAKLAQDVQLWREGLENARGSEKGRVAAMVRRTRGQMQTDYSKMSFEDVTVSEFPAKKATLPEEDTRVYFFVDTGSENVVFAFRDNQDGKVVEQIDGVMASVKIGYEEADSQ